MRRHTLTLTRVAGVPIALHARWLLVVLTAAALLANPLLPALYPRWDAITYWIVGVMVPLAVEVSLLFHELSHSLVALAHRVRVQGITMTGFAADTLTVPLVAPPRAELRICLAGPLANVVLAALLAALYLALPARDTPLAAILGLVALNNVAAVGLNLIPLGPSDGGRALRALQLVRAAPPTFR